MPCEYGSLLPSLGEYNRSGCLCLEELTVEVAVERREVDQQRMEGTVAPGHSSKWHFQQAFP